MDEIRRTCEIALDQEDDLYFDQATMSHTLDRLAESLELSYPVVAGRLRDLHPQA